MITGSECLLCPPRHVLSKVVSFTFSSRGPSTPEVVRRFRTQISASTRYRVSKATIPRDRVVVSLFHRFRPFPRDSVSSRVNIDTAKSVIVSRFSLSRVTNAGAFGTIEGFRLSFLFCFGWDRLSSRISRAAIVRALARESFRARHCAFMTRTCVEPR